MLVSSSPHLFITCTRAGCICNCLFWGFYFLNVIFSMLFSVSIWPLLFSRRFASLDLHSRPITWRAAHFRSGSFLHKATFFRCSSLCFWMIWGPSLRRRHISAERSGYGAGSKELGEKIIWTSSVPGSNSEECQIWTPVDLLLNHKAKVWKRVCVPISQVLGDGFFHFSFKPSASGSWS